jgi:two-component system sensor histidine kinase BaeS
MKIKALMRVRLIHTVSLLLVSWAFLAVLAMGAVNVWNLRNGFLDYMLNRDTATLDELAADLSVIATKAGGFEKLAATNMPLREIVSAMADMRRAPRGPALSEMSFAEIQSRLADHVAPRARPDLNADESRPPARAPHDFDNVATRVAIYTNEGRPLMGPHLELAKESYVERPLLINGESRALLRLLKRIEAPRSRETNFLNHQFTTIFLVACGLLIISLICAQRIARYWVRPLLELQIATERIAQGEFGVRLKDTRSDEIGDAMRNINRMAQGLQRMDDSRRQWIADISHELRTPLAVLRGEIDALIDGVRPLTPKAIESLREEALRLGSLVDDLHLLSMADLKALPCYFEEIEAQNLLKRTTQRFTLKAIQRQLTIQLHTEQTSPVMVRWDAKRIEQLVSNLLENSLRYTDAPGEIHIRLAAHDKHVYIDIEDSAPGVTVEELPKLFEPLYRVDMARSRDSGGSGLGLAICKAIVQAHRGSVEAKPSALGGLQIHIELPLSAEVST